MNRKLLGILTFLLVILGVMGVCLFVGSGIQKIIETEKTVDTIAEQMERWDEEMRLRQRNLAKWYNYSLTGKSPAGDYESAYEDILNVSGGMMGYLEIPGIRLRLPVHHGVTEDTPYSGFGHLPGTAFPVGGQGNHTVLMGPTEIAGLSEGDLIYIRILNDTLVYEVLQVRSVSPGNTSGLSAVEREDLCTLISNVSAGTKPRKIMVRTKRIDPEREEGAVLALEKSPVMDKGMIRLVISAMLAVLLLPTVTGCIGWGIRWLAKKRSCGRSIKILGKIAHLGQKGH